MDFPDRIVATASTGSAYRAGGEWAGPVRLRTRDGDRIAAVDLPAAAPSPCGRRTRKAFPAGRVACPGKVIVAASVMMSQSEAVGGLLPAPRPGGGPAVQAP